VSDLISWEGSDPGRLSGGSGAFPADRGPQNTILFKINLDRPGGTLHKTW